MERAFTLMEVLIVVIIIGVLAALGLPQYHKTRETALLNEAIGHLKLIAAAERVYRMEGNGVRFFPSSGSNSDLTQINAFLKLAIPSEDNWDFNIVGGTSFTAYADRVNYGGPYQTCRYAINSATTDNEPYVVSGTCP